MILTKHFVFVHLPKTAGQFVTAQIKRFAPPEWELGELYAHTWVKDCPGTHRHLPKFGVIRNPYSWYLSWHIYHGQKYKVGEVAEDHLWSQVSDRGRRSFDETLRNLFDHRQILNEGGDVGGFSVCIQRHFGPFGTEVEAVRMERLRTELISWLAKVIKIPEGMRESVEQAPKKNVSNDKHYSLFYDNGLRDLVRHKDRHVFDRFGYEFQTAEEERANPIP